MWNSEGKGSPEEIDKLIKDKFKGALDVICLQEANLPTETKTTDNFVWHCSGTSGSAVLIKKDLANVEVVAFEAVCEQIYIVDLKHENSIIKVISCYIPASTNYVCEEVWEKLINVLKAIPTTMTYVLAGDFNAQVGKNDAKTVPSGGFGTLVLHKETSDENGLKLVNLVRNASLRVANTFKPFILGRFIKHFTYIDSDHTKAQRSFVIVPKNRNAISLHNFYSGWLSDYKHAVLRNNMKIIVSTTCELTVILVHCLGQIVFDLVNFFAF